MKGVQFIFSDLFRCIVYKISYLKHNLKGARNEPQCRIHMDAQLESGTGFFGTTFITSNVKIGKFTYATNAIIQNAVIGKFCSIAPGVKIGLNEHPTDCILLHPMGYDANKFNSNIPKTIIGNDVWLCANSIVLSGVEIGDGAIVAAGAVVTKSVAPFTIVGGVPAKVIGNRKMHPLFKDIIKCQDTTSIKEILKKVENDC